MMSNLTNLEKRKFEKFFGMASGYVLDFSNRSLAEFVVDSTGLNIYDSRYDYGSGSKANRLRKFWQQEDDRVVGKLMSDMLEYGLDGTRQNGLAEDCRQIVARLQQSGGASDTQSNSQRQAQTSGQQQRSHKLSQLREEFNQLAVESNRSKAGLGLEKLLNRLFELFELFPRQAFRVTGEQIDGSFELDGD